MDEFDMTPYIGEQDEFPLLHKKIRKLQSIFKKYEFNDLVTAVFCINSWRDNRSVFESCCALNMALDNYSELGKKQIKNYEEFKEFFNSIKKILKPTMYDDITLQDFGEVRLKYKQTHYKVIIGTGYESNYAAISCLSETTRILGLEKEYEDLLTYVSNVLSFLSENNVTQYKEMDKHFDVPTEEYFSDVQNLFSSKFIIGNKKVIDILSDKSLRIGKRHFLHKNETLYPIFNTSILVDFNSALIKMLNSEQLNRVVSNTITNLLHDNFDCFSENNDILYPVSIGENGKLTSTRPYTFLAKVDNGFILAINKDEFEEEDFKKEIKKIRKLHITNQLNIVGVIPIEKDSYKAYHIPKEYNLDIIAFDTYIDVTQSRFIGITKENDYLFYSGLDVINYIITLEDFKELAEYFDFKRNDQARLFGIGSSINHFIFWKQNSKTLEKGAIHFSLIHIDYGMVDNFIYDFYKDLEDFPFEITNNFIKNPFAWHIKEYEDDFKEYQAKSVDGLWGYGKSSKSNFLFFAHNIAFHNMEIFSMEDREKKILLDGLNAKLLKRYGNQLDKLFSNKILYLLYMPEEYAKKVDRNGFTYEQKKYVNSDLYENDNILQIRYTVKLTKLLEDIRNAKNKSIEIEYLLELLNPLRRLYPESFEIFEKEIIADKNDLKEVDVFQIQLKYYYKDINQIFRIKPIYFTKAKKEIAKLCFDSEIETGKYYKQDADTVFKQIENKLVDFLENKILQFSQEKLTIEILRLLSNSLHLTAINKFRYSNVKDIEENALNQVKEKSMNEREEYKRYSRILYYFLETNLYLKREIDKDCSGEEFLTICAYIDWIITLQDNANTCKFTPVDMEIEFDSEYVPKINISDKDSVNNVNMQKRAYEVEDYHISIDKEDKEFLQKVIEAFEKDTNIDFQLLREFLTYISMPQKDEKFFREKADNVFEADIEILVNEFNKGMQEAYPNKYKKEDTYKIINYLTIDINHIKTIKSVEYKGIPFWNREHRDNRIEVKPLIKINEKLIYTPIMCHELNSRWENGFLDFYLPYEIGLDKTMETLRNWKKKYEDLMVEHLGKKIEDLKIGKVYKNIYLNILDPIGKSHPKDLGDYDILIIDDINHIIWNLECKFIHKCGSVFEVAMQQKDFFDDTNKKNRYSYKFKKRIDYLSNLDNYQRIIKHLKLSEGKYTINSILVTNKVFSSLGYQVDYELLSYNETIDRIKYYYNKNET